jgi:uncharacterized protein
MRTKLDEVLRTIPRPVIAVSGGVDSVTLAARSVDLGIDAILVHASSPAVPAQATERLTRLAQERGWNLLVIDAHELEDRNYRANPVNRCFFCKLNLYSAIKAKFDRQILSGANIDDLGEYRPGLSSAARFGVRHPYIEAGFDKAAVRQLASDLGLHDVAQLPASPCLSSRMETGLPIDAATLGFIDSVERLVTSRVRPKVVRCRVRAAGIVIELDPEALTNLTATDADWLVRRIEQQPSRPPQAPVQFAGYRNGSAFVHGASQ